MNTKDVQFTFDDSNVLEIEPDLTHDDELNISQPKKRLPIKKSTKPKVTFQKQMNTPQRPPPVPRPPPPTQQSQPQFIDKSFESFSNPQKRMSTDFEAQSVQSDESIQDDADENDEVFSQMDEPGFGADEPGMAQDLPSEGFDTIDDEKQDLLYRFHRLTSKGVKVSKNFNMYSDIREMRSEFKKIKRDSEVNSSLKFSKQILMAIVSGTEFLNKRYDPMGIELNGWSETVMENMNDGDYDNVFEKLHDKYTGRVNTPPELELMMSLAGSAVMFHMTSTMFKSIPNMSDMAKQNPDLQNAMKNMADNLMKAQMQPQSSQPAPSNTDGPREMRGPSMNLGDFGSLLPPPTPAGPVKRVPSPQSSISTSSSDSSSMSGISVKQVSVAMSEGGTRRGRRPKNQATKANTIEI